MNEQLNIEIKQKQIERIDFLSKAQHFVSENGFNNEFIVNVLSQATETSTSKFDSDVNLIIEYFKQSKDTEALYLLREITKVFPIMHSTWNKVKSDTIKNILNLYKTHIFSLQKEGDTLKTPDEHLFITTLLRLYSEYPEEFDQNLNHLLTEQLERNSDNVIQRINPNKLNQFLCDETLKSLFLDQVKGEIKEWSQVLAELYIYANEEIKSKIKNKVFDLPEEYAWIVDEFIATLGLIDGSNEIIHQGLKKIDNSQIELLKKIYSSWYESTELLPYKAIIRYVSENLQKTRELLKQSPKSLVKLTDIFNISNFSRYPMHLLKTLVDLEKSEKPWIWMVYAKDDYNREFVRMKKILNTFSNELFDMGILLVLTEISSTKEFLRQALQLRKELQPCSGMYVVAHGSWRHLRLSHEEIISADNLFDTREGKIMKRRDWIKKFFTPRPTIIFLSCYSGQNTSVASKVSSELGITIIGCDEETNVESLKATRVGEKIEIDVTYSRGNKIIFQKSQKEEKNVDDEGLEPPTFSV